MVRIVKISDIFEVTSGIRIIESDIYNHNGEFPCVTAQSNKDGIAWHVDEKWIRERYPNSIFGNNPVITWTKDGAKCGSLFYRDYEFFCTDVCGVLKIRDRYKKELDLKYFMYYLKTIIENYVSSQNTQGKLYNSAMSNIDIKYPFPSIKEQNAIVEQYEKLKIIKNKINFILDSISKLKETKIDIDIYKEYKMKDICLLNKGTNKISEEMIYYNQDINGIPVYSSATHNDGIMGTVSKGCYNLIDKKGFKNELTWTTNGYAGVVFYREQNYLYSEKCGRIQLKDEYQNFVSLKFLMYQLNTLTLQYRTSESNNGKLDIIHMKEIPVKLPIKDDLISIEQQNKIVEQYERVDKYKNNLITILQKIDKLI